VSKMQLLYDIPGSRQNFTLALKGKITKSKLAAVP
jgi:hypothetical protein